MIRRKVLVFGCGLVILLAFGASAQEAAPQAATESNEIAMTAKKYEFNPSTITVKKGERVKLVITATDRDHGFKIKDLGIEESLKKGVPTTVEFTAEKPGEFEFQCSKFCGFGHGRMKGKLIVEE